MPRSEVIRNDEPTGTIINGAILEAAIRWNDQFLVFVSDNIPNEETLHVYLLAANMRVIDSARMGWIYTPATFSLVEIRAPDEVRFRFLGDAIWIVTMLSEEEFALPYFSSQCGVARPFGFRRRFTIQREPKSRSR